MRLIGVDLHADSFYVAATRLTPNGPVRTERRYALSALDSFARGLGKEDYLLVEATTNAFWFHDRIRPLVKECFILNVNAVKFAGNKTDRIDAHRLQDILLYYVHVKGVAKMPAVYVPRSEVRHLRALLSTYALNRKIENQLKNRIHSLLKQAGLVVPRERLFAGATLTKILATLPVELSFHIRLIARQLVEVKRTTVSIRNAIVSDGMKTFPDEIKLLLTIPGFGVFAATLLLADIGTVARFRSAKRFCAYLRTAPRIKESNATTHLGGVSKQSRPMTCSVLTQSVLHFKKAGPHFSAFYNRIRTGKSSGRARIALIRKMLVAAYFMLKRGQPFAWVDQNRQEKKRSRILREVQKVIECHENERRSGEVAKSA